MAVITDFDKKMFEKYKQSILHKMKDMANFNMSAAISRLIGGLNGTEPYDGFFIKANHSSNTSDRAIKKAIAIKELKDFLNLDHSLAQRVENFISEFNGCYEEDFLTDATFQKYLAIYPGNMAESLNDLKKFHDKKNVVEIEINFEATQNKSDIWSSQKPMRLYLPKIIFNGGKQLSFMFDGIVKHYKGDCSSKINIYLEGQSIGKEDCLYAFIIKVFQKSNKPWEMENGQLKKSENLPQFFKESGMLKYCDYFIVTCNKSGQYFALPVATTSEENYEWKDINNRSSLSTRFNKKFIIKKTNGYIDIAESVDSNFKISLSELGNGGKEADSNSTSTPIIHMLIFNNRNDSNLANKEQGVQFQPIAM